jgi:hypothetical protein
MPSISALSFQISELINDECSGLCATQVVSGEWCASRGHASLAFGY